MNEAEIRTIEKLLDKQAERFEKRMDIRLQEQAEAFTKQIDTRFEEQEKRLDSRFLEQEKRLDIRLEEQEKRLEKRMIQVFNEGFEQVVLQHLSEINENIGELDSRTSRIERKLDAVVERQDRQGEEIISIKKFIRMPEGA
jgi:hypothetical protein